MPWNLQLEDDVVARLLRLDLDGGGRFLAGRSFLYGHADFRAVPRTYFDRPIERREQHVRLARDGERLFFALRIAHEIGAVDRHASGRAAERSQTAHQNSLTDVWNEVHDSTSAPL